MASISEVGGKSSEFTCHIVVIGVCRHGRLHDDLEPAGDMKSLSGRIARLAVSSSEKRLPHGAPMSNSAQHVEVGLSLGAPSVNIDGDGMLKAFLILRYTDLRHRCMPGGQSLRHESHLPRPYQDLGVVRQDESEYGEGSLLKSDASPSGNIFTLRMCKLTPVKALAISALPLLDVLQESDRIHEIANVSPKDT